jgi:hypothetical protein
MLKTLEQTFAKSAPPTPRNWSAIAGFLDAKVSAGGSKASAAKVKSAANGLLKAKGMTAEHARLDTKWFDRMFPVDGWDPAIMEFEQHTYQDYRNRVRPVLEEMLGTTDQKKNLREKIDDWDEAARLLERLGMVAGTSSQRKMIPFRSTLTMKARWAGHRTVDLDQTNLLAIYSDAKKSERPSLRAASRMISDGQKLSQEVARMFPHPIQPIEADSAFRYFVPEHFGEELEEFIERAARKKYIRAKKIHEYVKPKTRIGLRTAMRAVVDALIATGHLSPQANSFAAKLEDPEALADMLGHIVARIGEDGITARHATTLVARLPVMFERNGIDSGELRGLIKEVEELRYHAGKAGMPERTKRFCRALIERRKFRNSFLLAHAGPRLVAQKILDTASRENRQLTPGERRKVIRHGAVALFCAIEIGGAPVRVENVLEMPFGGEDAWLRTVGREVHVLIPGNFVKNGEEIRFKMLPGPHRFAETVHWYLDQIRPLILTDPATQETKTSPWLLPMVSDSARPCPYETFHDWFVRIMRDVVGVRCTPHNYRHGQASLLYHRHPDRLGWIAVRLGDTTDTVLRNYAWVHTEIAMAEGQQLIADLIDT